MNNYLTYTAKAKLRSLSSSGALATKISLSNSTGFNIEPLYKGHGEILLCVNPRVVTDLHTLKVLEDHSIDYDYQKQEFILKRAA
jgi:hypothetical protein